MRPLHLILIAVGLMVFASAIIPDNYNTYRDYTIALYYNEIPYYEATFEDGTTIMIPATIDTEAIKHGGSIASRVPEVPEGANLTAVIINGTRYEMPTGYSTILMRSGNGSPVTAPENFAE